MNMSVRAVSRGSFWKGALKGRLPLLSLMGRVLIVFNRFLRTSRVLGAGVFAGFSGTSKWHPALLSESGRVGACSRVSRRFCTPPFSRRRVRGLPAGGKCRSQQVCCDLHRLSTSLF